MSSRHLLVSKFLFSVYKFVRVFNKKSFTPLRGEQILWDRTDFSNEANAERSLIKSLPIFFTAPDSSVRRTRNSTPLQHK
jgi:hypothetical protein